MMVLTNGKWTARERVIIDLYDAGDNGRALANLRYTIPDLDADKAASHARGLVRDGLATMAGTEDFPTVTLTWEGKEAYRVLEDYHAEGQWDA